MSEATFMIRKVWKHPQTSLHCISESFPCPLTQIVYSYMQELSKSTEFRTKETFEIIEFSETLAKRSCLLSSCTASVRQLFRYPRPSSLEADFTANLGLQLKFVFVRSKQTKYLSWKFERNSGPRVTNWHPMVFPSSNLTYHWCSCNGPRRGLM